MDKQGNGSSGAGSVRKVEIAELVPIFRRWLPSELINRLLRETGQRFYERVLPPVVVLWGFIFQRLNHDHTCDAAWAQISGGELGRQLGVEGGRERPVSASTSGYCQARGRLPLSLAQALLPWTAQVLGEELGEQCLWHGQRVTLFDGSTLRLPASRELVGHYGVATNQHGASHWPLMRLVAGFDVYTGAMRGVSEGPYRSGEHTLAVDLVRRLGAGYVHLADRNFGVYHIVQVAVGVGSAAVVRLKITQARRLAEGNLEPGMDRLVEWTPSRHDTCEADLPAGPIMGRLIYARIERAGAQPIHLYLFTTLTDRAEYPAEELVALYGMRWGVEVDLRHVKTTLQMECLAGKSVAMVRKELLLGLVAYNLLRGLMAAAALRVGRSPHELSLAQCWRRTLVVAHTLPADASPEQIAQTADRLLDWLGRCVLPKRPHRRSEPRAVWGRPRVYPTIKHSREQARLEAENLPIAES